MGSISDLQDTTKSIKRRKVMQSLTSQTFTEAMTLCCEHNHYKVCVVFDNREAMIEFIAELREIGNIPNVRRAIVRRTDYGRLEFFNGSIIEIIIGRENSLRGRKCNQLIVSGVFGREIQPYMKQMIVPYRATESTQERIIDAALFGLRTRQKTAWESSNDDLPAEHFEESSEELDAFLDSFAVSEKLY